MHFIVAVLISTLFVVNAKPLHDCNQAECASAVAECALSCACDYPVCECCTGCALCLGDLWNGCCDCFNICGPSITSEADLQALNVTEVTTLVKHIQGIIAANRTDILVLPQADNGLLTGQLDNSETRFPWEIVFYNINNNITAYAPVDADTNMQCQLIAYNNCMSLNSCIAQCQSIGSAGYVWFNNYGCCECYGPAGCYDPSWPTYPLCSNCH
jgi:Twisted gastrulation (Tsg) protein conserved region